MLPGQASSASAHPGVRESRSFDHSPALRRPTIPSGGFSGKPRAANASATVRAGGLRAVPAAVSTARREARPTHVSVLVVVPAAGAAVFLAAQVLKVALAGALTLGALGDGPDLGA